MSHGHRPSCPLRDLHPQIVRRGPRAGIQFSRCPAGSVRGLYREPASCRMGRACGHVRRRRPVRRDDGAAGAQAASEDIKASKVQIVVVYKVDRLTRSLADLAKIVYVLDARNASVRLSLPIRAGPEKAESGGDSQAAQVMIHPAGWEEASLDGKTLFAGFAGTHDVGCSLRKNPT